MQHRTRKKEIPWGKPMFILVSSHRWIYIVTPEVIDQTTGYGGVERTEITMWLQRKQGSRRKEAQKKNQNRATEGFPRVTDQTTLMSSTSVLKSRKAKQNSPGRNNSR